MGTYHVGLCGLAVVTVFPKKLKKEEKAALLIVF